MLKQTACLPWSYINEMKSDFRNTAFNLSIGTDMPKQTAYFTLVLRK